MQSFSFTAIAMTNFIPIFPLNIVVYPGEIVPLHIFEDRYIQLINDCFQPEKLFGIPSVIDEHINELGTAVRIKEIVKKYDNGRMDIRVEGLHIFRILEVIKSIPEKLYHGAIVTYPENDRTHIQHTMDHVMKMIAHLHASLHLTKTYDKTLSQLCSYDIAHYVAFSLKEEYELLTLLHESQRLEYLKRHLRKITPAIKRVEELKEKIRQNGHFRQLKGFDFY